MSSMRQAAGYVFDNFINPGHALGLPLIKGKWFFVDPLNGSDSRPGTSVKAPLKTFLAAYNKCTSWYGDGICVLNAGATTATTSCEFSAVLDWTKYGITVFGVAAPVGFFGRARLTNADSTAGNALAYLINITGQNNSFYNLTINQGATGATALASVIVAGNRNYFCNCHIMNSSALGMAELLCSSLNLKASECTFDNCAFGTNSTGHAAANAPLQFTTTQQGQNMFRNCRIYSKSSTAGAGGLNLVGTTVMNGWTTFDHCMFQNFSLTGGANTALTKVVIGDAQTDCGIHMHNCGEVGWAAWSTLASKVYVSASGETAAGAGGIATAPAA
jgi:hypothetical protein